MNRRAFLLGCVSTPIAAKMAGVSAALRPTADAITFNLSPGGVNYIPEGYMNANIRFALPICKWRLLNSAQFVELSAAEIAPLDRPGEPCDARFAGRDQIG